MKIDWEKASDDFRRDGVVYLPQLLGPEDLASARAAYDWTMANPGPFGGNISALADEGSTYYQDLCNPRSFPMYGSMLEKSPIPEAVAKLWNSDDVWLMYEQIFLKEGGAYGTPWHQDLASITASGDHLAGVWITFDPLPKKYCLGTVRGSHRGPLYDRPADNEVARPPPNVSAEEDKWDVVSWDITPGDVIIFHPGVLHGGGVTTGGMRRRTLTLRFFGSDAVYTPCRGAITSFSSVPMIEGFHERMKDGDPFRDPIFPKVFPHP